MAASEDSCVGSIRDLPPVETGGVIARTGFAFQDHVAAGFCLGMLDNSGVGEVWCESQDDITLIWGESSGERAEFVQVKSDQLDQLWSIAKLCDRDSGKTGTSIAEKSFAYDRPMKEECLFRIVTARGINQDLGILGYAVTNEHRLRSGDKIEELEGKMSSRIGDYRSPVGNKWEFWLSRTFWETRHSIDSVKDANLAVLRKITETWDEYLASDQVDEVYSKFLGRVYDAARIDGKISPDKKRIVREDLLDWFREVLKKSVHPAVYGGGQAMERKMGDAEIPSDTIESANDLRRRYRAETLKPKYLELADMRLVESEVAATLNRLKNGLDAGLYKDTGVQFHQRCLDELEEVRNGLQVDSKVNSFIVQGCMYSITERCPHRFKKVIE